MKFESSWAEGQRNVGQEERLADQLSAGEDFDRLPTDKPFAALRSPVVSLNENRAPGATSAPSIRSATSVTLCTRPGVPP